MEINANTFQHDRINLMADMKNLSESTFQSIRTHPQTIQYLKRIYKQIKSIRIKSINTNI